jgi:hypothetical protein
MKAILLRSQDGDWEGVFVDGKLIAEDHTIGEGNSIKWWLDFSRKYDVVSEDLTVHELNDADEKRLEFYGSLPDNLKHLSGTYEDLPILE